MMNVIPEKVKEIINKHIDLIESRLPNSLVGYYIYGSISLDAFDDGISDIDYVAILNRKVTETDLKILVKIHGDLHKKFKKTILDGMYLLEDDIKSLNKNEITCLRFNDGKFKGYSSFDFNSIDAFELKNYGITVKGQEIVNLKYTVDFDILISKMKDNLNTYWLKWVKSCKRFPSYGYVGLFISLKQIEWGVLGISRLYYTFLERNITSKIGAGEYALQTVPQKWHTIIKEAMRMRRGNTKSYYNSKLKRRNDALGYIEFIIQESNKLKK